MSKSYNAEYMNAEISSLLNEGERAVAAVYCAFTSGFFGRAYSNGYVAATDDGRIVGIKYYVFNSEPFAYSFENFVDVKFHRALVGYSADLVFKGDGRKKEKLSFLVSRKVLGDFPEQAENAERLRDELQELKYRKL